MEKQKTKPEFLLQDAFGFSEDDLEANRKGYLSQAQVEWLESQKNGYRNGILFAVGIGMLFSLVLILPGRTGNVSPIVLPIIGALWLAIAAACFYQWQVRAKYISDLGAGLAKVEGRVKLNIETPGNNRVTYTLSVEDVEFKVQKEAFLSFKNGDPYCIYCGPYTKQILSVDWLR
jgi:hypothetical protein